MPDWTGRPKNLIISYMSETKKFKERIYIVDDTVVFLKLFNHLLADYDTRTFQNPLEALKVILDDPPDLVLSDLEMPKVNGIKLLELVRAEENIKDLPFIICTSHDEESVLEQAFRAGVTEFLSKENVSGQILNIRVRNILDSAYKTKLIEEINKDKTTFLRVLCHDLVNPLCVSIGHQRMLKEKLSQLNVEDERITKALEGIDLANKKAQEIIEYTRDRVSVQDQKHEIILKGLSLDKLLDDIDFLITGLLTNKEINFERMASSDDIVFQCDMNTVTNQVFANIFTNAIKFTPRGGQIKFSIDQEDDWVTFKLRDNGIGIPDDLIEKLFDPNTTTSRKGTDRKSVV